MAEDKRGDAQLTRDLEKRLTVCEQEIGRLVTAVLLMCQCGQTLEDRVDEMEREQSSARIVPVGVKPS